jgi:riboflavin synthase
MVHGITNMFTGIIQSKSKVVSTQKKGSVIQVRLEKPRDWKLVLGQSISIDGICSTVTVLSKEYFEVDYMPETLSKTTAGSFAKGSIVNLERSLTLNDYIDGHIVQGHVDARARIAEVVEEGNTRRITIEIPKPLLRFVAALGSIAINGVSLTVARLAGSRATVALIPHTLAVTNLGSLKKGDVVNIEADLMARYIVAAMADSGRVGHAKKTLRKESRDS